MQHIVDSMQPPAANGWYEEIERMYARLDAELAPHQHLCEMRGVCCDFVKSDHLLFASEVEVRYALERLRRSGEQVPAAEREEYCPFWRKGICHARAERPLGCRTYFCAESWRGRGEEIYERYHAELQRIAERHSIPYRYTQWVARMHEARGLDPPSRQT